MITTYLLQKNQAYPKMVGRAHALVSRQRGSVAAWQRGSLGRGTAPSFIYDFTKFF